MDEFEGKESAFVSEWPRKTIFKSYYGAYKKKKANSSTKN